MSSAASQKVSQTSKAPTQAGRDVEQTPETGEQVRQVMGQSGMPLPPDLRQQVEARFGHDFSQVRIHTNDAASDSASTLGAKAYTIGEHIVFAEGRYAPGNTAGRHLLGHELAHVVQQRRGGPPPTMNAQAGHELGARNAATQFSQGSGAVQVSGATGVGIAREEDEDKRKGQKDATSKKTIDPLDERLQKIQADAQAAGLPKKQIAQAGAEVRRRIRGNRASAEEMLDAYEDLVRKARGDTDVRGQVLQDINEAQGMVGPERGPGGKRRQTTGDLDRAGVEQGRPHPKTVLRATVQEGESLGTEGGKALADTEGIEISKRDSAQRHMGDYGTGIDNWGVRKRDTNKYVIIEHKYGGSSLNNSSGVRQMSNEWVGRKIAELRLVGESETADELMHAAERGDLQGVVYWTRDLKDGPKTTRRTGAQLRDKLSNERISETGLIHYAPSKIRRAHDAHLADLRVRQANGTLPANITAMRKRLGITPGPSGAVPIPASGSGPQTQTSGIKTPAQAAGKGKASPRKSATPATTAGSKPATRKAATGQSAPRKAVPKSPSKTPAGNQAKTKKASQQAQPVATPKKSVTPTFTTPGKKASTAEPGTVMRKSARPSRTASPKKSNLSGAPKVNQAPEADTMDKMAVAKARKPVGTGKTKPSPTKQSSGKQVQKKPDEPQQAPSPVEAKDTPRKTTPTNAKAKKKAAQKPPEKKASSKPKQPLKAAPVKPSPAQKRSAPAQTKAPVAQATPPAAKPATVATTDAGEAGGTPPPTKSPTKAAPKPQTAWKGNADTSLIAGPGKAGIKANLGAEAKTDYGKGRSVSHSAAFSGKAWVETSEIPFSKPPRYRVVFHVNLGGQVGVGAEKEGAKATGSVGVAASGAMDLTVAHEFSAEETQKYLGDVQAGTSSAYRELRVAQLAAAGSLDDAKALAGQMKAVAGSPQGLAQMKEGDEVSFAATGGVEGNVGLSRGKGGPNFGIQLGGGVNAGLERRVALRNGKYIVTITSTRGTESTLGATGGWGVASMGVKQESSEGKGLSVSFVIDAQDPDRAAALFSQIQQAGSMEALQDLQAKHPELVGSRTTTQTKATGNTTTVGLPGVSLDITSKGELTEQVTESPEGVAREYTGKGTNGANIKVGDKPVLSGSDANVFTGGAGPDNKGYGETRNEQRSTEFLRSGQKAMEDFTKAPIGTTIGYLSGDKPILVESLQQHGAALTDDSYATLIALAKDRGKWSKAWSGSFGTWEEWMKTYDKVRAAGENRQMIAKAIAEFESEAGRGASDTVQKAVGVTGIAFEFPDQIADQKPLYDALIVGNPLAAAQGAGDRSAQIAYLRGEMEKLEALDKKINDNSSAFQRPGDFIEMRQRIGQRRKEMRAAIGQLSITRSPAPAGQKEEAKTEAPGLTEEQQAGLKKIQDAQQLVQDTAETIGRLQSYRRIEQGVFAAMEAEFKGSTVFGYELPKLSSPSVIELINQENKLKQAYPKWGQDIALLRRLLEQAGGDPSKADAFKPNRARYLELDRKIPYHSYGAGLPGYEEI